MRAFIAIDLVPEIKEHLLAVVRDLQAARADVRWIGAGGMHLTLKFLGEIDQARAARVKETLAAVASRFRPFPLRLEGTGAFPDERSPRVLWAGCAAGPELAALQREIEAALEAEGFEREARPFTPHLTLGRVKGPGRIDRAMSELSRRREEVFGAMTVGKIVLFESLLRPQGAEYRAVFEAVLS
jgi:RNA 2',3'-cyclic 3'-phosphodiesterase